MRLIDADKLKKDLINQLPEMSNWGEIFVPALIDKQPTVSQWISVNDGLPEDGVNVLTYDGKGNFHIFCTTKDAEYPFFIPPYHTCYHMPIVWMYLPQGYRGN